MSGAEETAEAISWNGTLSPSHADTLTSGGTPRRASDATEDELLAEIRLGRFTLLRVLGRGGMGVVYTAYDELLDRIVAIKLVRSDKSDPDLLARVLREAKALAKLSHPNVVQIYDVSESDGQVFIAMEFVDGPNLREWVAARREAGADAGELLAVLVQAGRGLAAAHAAGLVHRDFKPDNVQGSRNPRESRRKLSQPPEILGHFRAGEFPTRDLRLRLFGPVTGTDLERARGLPRSRA